MSYFSSIFLERAIRVSTRTSTPSETSINGQRFNIHLAVFIFRIEAVKYNNPNIIKSRPKVIVPTLLLYIRHHPSFSYPFYL